LSDPVKPAKALKISAKESEEGESFLAMLLLLSGTADHRIILSLHLAQTVRHGGIAQCPRHVIKGLISL
jgi:hypothetical protein